MLKMQMMIGKKRHIIKNYCPDDFNNYLQFYAELNRLDLFGLHITPKLLAEDLNYPNRVPEKNLFIAERNNTIIGFCELIPEADIDRILMDILVHPDFRNQGIASKLLNEALLRASEISLNRIHVNIRETNDAAKKFLIKQGFENVRRYHEMQFDMGNFPTGVVSSNTNSTRPLVQGEEDCLTILQNECFNGSWGFNPNSVEEVHYLLNSHGSAYEDVVLSFLYGEPVAYCWTRIHKDPNTRIKKGRIHMIGVSPRHRGEGLGKLILTAGLNRLKQKRVESVSLTTDSKNKSAVKLYRTFGFKLHWVVLWYEKLVKK